MNLFRAVAFCFAGFCTPMIAAAQIEHRPEIQIDDVQARMFSEVNGTSLEESKRRLRAVEDINDAMVAIRGKLISRVAGVYIEQIPDLHVVIRLTGEDMPAPLSIPTPNGIIPIVFITGASITAAELNRNIEDNRSAIAKAVPGFQRMYGDEKTGEVVLVIHAPQSERDAYRRETAALEKILGAPIRYEFRSSPTRVLEYTRGGAILQSNGATCTTGFAVKQIATNIKGVMTAGHCRNLQQYYNLYPPTDPYHKNFPIQFVDELNDQNSDMQWHVVGSGLPSPLAEIYGSSAVSGTIIMFRRARSTANIGTPVCHRGATTGYSCGTITSISTTTDPVACGLDPCASTWVEITGPTLACSQGDSGGPIFNGNAAYGIVSAADYAGILPRQCSAIVYMSLDYLPNLGIKLL